MRRQNNQKTSICNTPINDKCLLTGYMTQDWNNAVKEFHEYLEQNPEVKSSLYKLSTTNANIYNNPEVQEGFKQAEVDSGMVLSGSAMKFFTDTLSSIETNFKRSDEMDVDLNHFIDERVQLLNAVGKSVANQEVALDRSFRDIVQNGARNEAEELVHQTAKEFLEPAEFSQAVNEDMSVGQVLGKIEQSRINQFTRIFIAEEQQERSQEKIEAQEVTENPLSKDLSYVHALGENMGKAAVSDASLDDLSGPDHTPKVEKAEPSKGRST